MNHPQLTRLLENATTDLGADVDPEVLWGAGVRRRRRTTAAAASAAVAAVASTAAVVAMLATGDPSDPPQPAPSPTPTTAPTDARIEPALITRLTGEQVAPELHQSDIVSLPRGDGVPTSWDPVDPVPLEADPVDRAVVAVQSAWDEPAAISVLGDDGRWRSIDLTGIEQFKESYEYHLGINEGSFSPDGTILAISQPDGVVLVDVTNGTQTKHVVPGLGPAWHGRQTFWSADGSTIYLGKELVDDGRGFAVDVERGYVGRTEFDPTASAFLADGRIIEGSWRAADGGLRHFDTSGRVVAQSVDASGHLGSGHHPTANGDVWAALSKSSRSASGVLVLDDRAHPVRLLPVEGTYADDGRIRVLGWLDDRTVIFTARNSPDTGTIPLYVLAWDFTTDEVTRLADYIWTGAIALAPPT